MKSSILIRIYETVPPTALLIAGWLVFMLGMGWRAYRGVEVPILNIVFILLGLMAYFMPGWLIGHATGDTVRRKLLWLLVLAGLLILAGELFKPGLLPDQS